MSQYTNSSFTEHSIIMGLSYYYSDEYNNKCNQQSYFDSNINETLFLNETHHSCLFDKTYYTKTLTEEVNISSIHICFFVSDSKILCLKWNLICDRAIWRSGMQAIYFTGALVGSILLAYLAKK